MPDTAPRHIAANPLHTILAAYPIAFFTGAMVTDLVYAQTYEMQWANFSVWMIAAGLVMAGLAGVAGIVDAVRVTHTRDLREGTLYRLLAALGIDPWKERLDLLARYGVGKVKRRELARIPRSLPRVVISRLKQSRPLRLLRRSLRP